MNKLSGSGNSFDALRLIAAFLVFHTHQFVLSGRSEFIVPWLKTSLSGVGLAMFFVISGYLVTHSAARDPRLVSFFWKRGVRIMPGLACNVLFMVLLGALLTRLSLADYFASPVTREFAHNNFLIAVNDPRYRLPGVFEGNIEHGVNGALWTLPYEIALYVVIGLIMFSARDRVVRVALVLPCLIACIAILMVQIFSYSANYTFVVWNWLTTRPFGIYGSLFFIGALVALRKEEGLRHTSKVIAAIAFVFFWGDTAQAAAYVALGGAVLLIGESNLLQVPKRIGDISYGVYLYGFPVQQTVISLMGKDHFRVSYFAALLATAVLAYLSWRFIEKPALRLKPTAVKSASLEPSTPVAEAAQLPDRSWTDMWKAMK